MTYQTPTLVEVGKPEEVVHGPFGGWLDGIGPQVAADTTD
jgi:hypothetical protein